MRSILDKIAAQQEAAPPAPRALAPKPTWPGMLDSGNIDMATRPRVRNKDGSISTVRSMSIGVDGREYLIPTVSDDGRVMSDDEAIQSFFKTGRHLGIFADPKSATEYARWLHDREAEKLGRK